MGPETHVLARVIPASRQTFSNFSQASGPDLDLTQCSPAQMRQTGGTDYNYDFKDRYERIQFH